MSASNLADITVGAVSSMQMPQGRRRLNLFRAPQPRIAMAKFRTMEDTRHPTTGAVILGVCPALKDALRACAMGQSAWPMTMLSDAGVGKTCAALALADYVNGRCWMHSLEELCEARNLIRQNRWSAFYGFREDAWSDRFFWQKTEAFDLLIVDEIGTKPSQSWDADLHLNTLKKILDVREGKATILTCNLRIDKLYEIYDERVVSRLSAGTIIESQDSDRRPLI